MSEDINAGLIARDTFIRMASATKAVERMAQDGMHRRRVVITDDTDAPGYNGPWSLGMFEGKIYLISGTSDNTTPNVIILDTKAYNVTGGEIMSIPAAAAYIYLKIPLLPTAFAASWVAEAWKSELSSSGYTHIPIAYYDGAYLTQLHYGNILLALPYQTGACE